MEDLREVGKRVLDRMKTLRPADAGDLVLGIGEIIEELREEYQGNAKLGHLEGMFREFAYDEPYEFRNDRTEEESDNQTTTTMGGGTPVYASGIMPVSGWLLPQRQPSYQTPPSSLPTSQNQTSPGIEPPIWQNQKVEHQQYPVTLSPFDDDDDDVVEEEPLEPEEPPKPFKPKWWQKKI